MRIVLKANRVVVRCILAAAHPLSGFRRIRLWNLAVSALLPPDWTEAEQQEWNGPDWDRDDTKGKQCPPGCEIGEVLQDNQRQYTGDQQTTSRCCSERR